MPPHRHPGWSPPSPSPVGRTERSRVPSPRGRAAAVAAIPPAARRGGGDGGGIGCVLIRCGATVWGLLWPWGVQVHRQLPNKTGSPRCAIGRCDTHGLFVECQWCMMHRIGWRGVALWELFGTSLVMAALRAARVAG